MAVADRIESARRWLTDRGVLGEAPAGPEPMPLPEQPDRADATFGPSGLTKARAATGFNTSYAETFYTDSINAGYLKNEQTGQGFPSIDKAAQVSLKPQGWFNDETLEILRVQSWSCQAAVELIPEAATEEWLMFDEEDASSPRMVELEQEFSVQDVIRKAWIAGRLFGTSFVVLKTNEASLSTPLEIDQVMPGDLSHLIVANRYDVQDCRIENDPRSPWFGKVERYKFQFQKEDEVESPDETIPQIDVHASRVLQFDGVKQITSYGFHQYDRCWGISILVACLPPILQEEMLSDSTAHLTQESSMLALYLDGLNEAARAGGDTGSMSAGELPLGTRMRMFNESKSNYRTMTFDGEDRAERVGVGWGGLAPLYDKHAVRIAAACRIPATVFWGKSPDGMNATGESDERIWAKRIKTEQRKVLDGMTMLPRLHEVLARHGGLMKAPSYKWVPLLDPSLTEQTINAKQRTEAVNGAVMGGTMTADEGRAVMADDPLFEKHVDLTMPAPGPPMMDEEDGGDEDGGGGSDS